MKEKENQRVMLTKRLIKESLIRLLVVKSIYKISIRELCENANINRSTFYKYFGSQYDVLNDLESELLDHIQEALKASAKTPEQQIVTICSYLDENIELVRLLTNNNVDPDFPGKLFNLPLIKQMLHEKMNDFYGEENFDYVFTFVINGGYFLIKEWINRNERKRPEEIASLVLELEEKVCRNF